MGRDAATAQPRATRINGQTPPLAYRVLASGSSGNCSIVRASSGRAGDATILIDLGLSQRRTRLELERAGLALDAVDVVLLTHLDADHCRPAWAARLPARVRVVVHAAHMRQARAIGWPASRLEALDDGPVALTPNAVVSARRARHDRLGVAAYRIECAGATLGHATDIGAPTQALANFLQGVDALGLESNYCPRLQLASARPAFLKRRIMGGAGHLSNEQSAELVAAVEPRQQVVLLHLSRQCNRPETAMAQHAGHGVPVALSWQHRSTPWFALQPLGPPAQARVNGRIGGGQLALGYGTRSGRAQP